eukprot:IDg18911t1
MIRKVLEAASGFVAEDEEDSSSLYVEEIKQQEKANVVNWYLGDNADE